MKRGRKSSAELALITPIDAARPAAPEGLTEAQVNVWCDVVLRLPASWFPRETHHLLAEYCKAVTRARFIGAELDRFQSSWLAEDGGPERYLKLSGAADRQVRTMNALARALRITNQSRLKAETAARKASAPGADSPRPWD